MGMLSLLVTAFILAGCVYFYMVIQLPDVDALKDTRLQEPLRIYSVDGHLIGEYGEMHRTPVALDQVPQPLIQAIIATEDRRFFDHPGVDFIGLARASRELLMTGKKSQGASTITMQVARNFFLTRKKTYSRKINEILLALKINSTFSKEKILELYLNKIYLGQRAYGVAAAAQIYFGKNLNELTLAEMATIAGLPQSPSKENPITNPEAAKQRRNHVLQRMYEDGYIDQKAYEMAFNAPITARFHGAKITLEAPYVAEMARNAIFEQYGDNAYTDGLKVYTTVHSHMQQLANHSLGEGLVEYDQRHGYRGRERNLGRPSPETFAEWQKILQSTPVVHDLHPAAVIEVNSRSVNALLSSGETINIPWEGLSWAKRYIADSKYTGDSPQSASNLVKPGDLIRVEKSSGHWRLSQIPRVEGALVALNPSNGAIEALVGGFNYGNSNFNRATQAYRQPGSNFKPFIYAAALANGFTLASIINDAPVVIKESGENNYWRPKNDEMHFYGPTRLRIGLAKSRNLVTIRLLQAMGIPYTIDYLKKFGFNPKSLPQTPSLALGTADVTPLQIASGYAVFANGGYRVTPYFIEQIRNSDDKIVYQANPPTVCTQCTIQNATKPVPPRAIDYETAFFITSALQDVIRIGTGHAASVLNRGDIAGKTGSTNNNTNAWFSGYNRDIVVTVWVGFDKLAPLYEYGSQAALPIWIDFMRSALDGKPEHTLPEPEGIMTVRIDPATGLLAATNQSNAIFEYFRADEVPTQSAEDAPPEQNENGEIIEGAAQQQGMSFNTGDNSDAQLF